MTFNQRPVSRSASRRQLPVGARRYFDTEYIGHNSNETDVFRNNRSTWRRPTGNGGDTARPWGRRDAVSNKILLVHGLEHLAINCDQVFNLFCLYGNLLTVKFLKDKQVLVEMENIEAAKRCVENLHLLPLGDGRKLRVKYSKLSYIYNGRIHRLQDGTPALKVYSTSRLNRFQSSRTRHEKLVAPSKILHFYNAPTDLCGVKLQEAVTGVVGSVDAVKSIVILPVKQGNKSSTGLIEMKTIGLTAKVICRLNHMAFTSTKSRFPFFLKVCFSKWSDINEDSSAVLLGTTAPYKPWLRHGSEQRRAYTSEFPVARKTRVAGGDNNHASWTLLSLSGDTAEIITASADDDPTAANRPQPAGHQQAGCDAENASSGERPNGAREDRGDAAT